MLNEIHVGVVMVGNAADQRHHTAVRILVFVSAMNQASMVGILEEITPFILGLVLMAVSPHITLELVQLLN